MLRLYTYQHSYIVLCGIIAPCVGVVASGLSLFYYLLALVVFEPLSSTQGESEKGLIEMNVQ